MTVSIKDIAARAGVSSVDASLALSAGAAADRVGLLDRVQRRTPLMAASDLIARALIGGLVAPSR